MDYAPYLDSLTTPGSILGEGVNHLDHTRQVRNAPLQVALLILRHGAVEQRQCPQLCPRLRHLDHRRIVRDASPRVAPLRSYCKYPAGRQLAEGQLSPRSTEGRLHRPARLSFRQGRLPSQGRLPRRPRMGPHPLPAAGLDNALVVRFEISYGCRVDVTVDHASLQRQRGARVPRSRNPRHSTFSTEGGRAWRCPAPDVHLYHKCCPGCSSLFQEGSAGHVPWEGSALAVVDAGGTGSYDPCASSDGGASLRPRV